MKDATEIVAVLDRSASMGSIVDDAIGGFNTFLKEQKKIPGEANLRVVLFDDRYETFYNGPIQDAVEMTSKTYVPRGWTALLDAVGRAINETGEKLKSLPEEERPDKIIFVILTDGRENASKEFNKSHIFDMITHQRKKYSWEFVFLAANQDAIAEGGQLGIMNSCNFVPTGTGMISAYSSISRGVTRYRKGVSVNASDFEPDPVDSEDNK